MGANRLKLRASPTHRKSEGQQSHQALPPLLRVRGQQPDLIRYAQRLTQQWLYRGILHEHSPVARHQMLAKCPYLQTQPLQWMGGLE